MYSWQSTETQEKRLRPPQDVGESSHDDGNETGAPCNADGEDQRATASRRGIPESLDIEDEDDPSCSDDLGISMVIIAAGRT